MVWNGILLGISLSFMIGPLFFSIVQASLQRGFRAGIAVASGMWVSDFIYVGAVTLSIERFAAVVEMPGFRYKAGILGGLLLMVFGLVSLLKKNKIPHTLTEKTTHSTLTDAASNKILMGYWLQGFLINTINPGTIFFWLGIATAVVIPGNWSFHQSMIFFASMLGTLIMTDTLKAYGAKTVRQWMTQTHISLAQKGIGALLIIFGTVMMWKAFSL